MDTTTFKELISNFLDDDSLSINLDFLTVDENGYHSFSTNPNDELKEEILKSFTSKLNQINHLSDFQILDIYDDNASNTEVTFYSDKIANNKIASKIFSFSRVDIEPFDFDSNSMSELFGIIIELDNGQDKLKIFKKTYPIQVIKKRTTHNFFSNEGSLKLFKKDLFQLNDKIHILSTGDQLVIVAKKVYLDYFGFKERLRKDAELNLASIQATNKFEVSERINVGSLTQSYQKKLKACVEQSPIYLNQNFTRLQQHSKEYGGREIKINDDGLFNIKSKKDLIVLIDFLNRDFNKNEVTGEVFKTPSKKRVK